MSKKDTDKLRSYILWAIECYNVAAHPPALNYTKQVDPTYRDDVNAYSRAYLLRLSIDAKYALNTLLHRIPRKRANVLLGWLAGDEDYYWHKLTYQQQFFLKIDRAALKKFTLKSHNEG